MLVKVDIVAEYGHAVKDEYDLFHETKERITELMEARTQTTTIVNTMMDTFNRNRWSRYLRPLIAKYRADRNEHTIDQAREVWCETKVIVKRISTEREFDAAGRNRLRQFTGELARLKWRYKKEFWREGMRNPRLGVKKTRVVTAIVIY